MTHDELLEIIDFLPLGGLLKWMQPALRAVVELHRPEENWGADVCTYCFDMAWERTGLSMDNKQFTYPCPTIKTIEKELNGGI